ncbi:hypothetical protein IQ06DRAFT_368699 [Phaeosphaeriaceae sp. SRC1lsM3a]|nr:hypothetical protein IQ06DRAFT_368699 [Stagonospora sp. SRC1lsM3a]
MSSGQILGVELGFERLTLTYPRYNRCDEISTAEDRSIFGSAGMIIPALRRLARMNDDSGIQFLIELVMQQALSVANAWAESRTAADSHHPGMPSYHWYVLSLLEARDNFICSFYEAESMADRACRLREAVIDLPFVDLWNALWKQQRLIANLGIRSEKEYISLMYIWVLESFMSLQPVSAALLTRIHSTIARYWNLSYDGASSAPRVVDPSVLTENIDFGFIKNADLRRYRPLMCLHWGMYLYPEETRDLDSWLYGPDAYNFVEEEDDDEEWDSDEEEDELEEFILNTNDQSHLEACGPIIDPRAHADCVTDAPEDQNCTICVEDFVCGAEAEGGVWQQCLRMQACGHYFHEDCIGQWMNGIAANSNLCPECRGMMFEERRAVRAVITSA